MPGVASSVPDAQGRFGPYGGRFVPETLMHALRHLIGRAGPTAMEVDLLFGLARQLRWIAGRCPKPPEGETSASGR